MVNSSSVPNQEIIIIAAMAENRVIGRNNVMPWSIKEEMAHFTRLTKGYPCIMGRKTWDSLPKKPLPGRLNIVVSRTMAADDQALSPNSLNSSSVPNEEQKSALTPKSHVSNPTTDFKLCPSLPAAIELCANYEKIFICGGETIYRQALELANKIELTVIHKEYEGDTFFPEIDETCWTITNREDSSSVPNSAGDFDAFSFITYNKISNFGKEPQ